MWKINGWTWSMLVLLYRLFSKHFYKPSAHHDYNHEHGPVAFFLASIFWTFCLTNSAVIHLPLVAVTKTRLFRKVSLGQGGQGSYKAAPFRTCYVFLLNKLRSNNVIIAAIFGECANSRQLFRELIQGVDTRKYSLISSLLRFSNTLRNWTTRKA